MFNRQNQNQQGNDNGVTTNVKTLFSSLSCLTISCWNDSFSLRFMPATSTDANGNNHYDKNAKIQTSLSVAEAAGLAKDYKKHMEARVDAGEDPGENGISAAVDMPRKDGTHKLSIEYKKDEKGIPSMYLTFARNVDANGVATMNSIISYKFNDVGVVDDYNPLTGAGTPHKVEGEFEFFLNILKNAHLMTGLLHHAARMQKQFQRGNGLTSFISGGNNQQQQQVPQDFMNAYDGGMSELPFN